MMKRAVAVGLACALSAAALAGPGDLKVFAGPWVVSEHEAPGAINQFPVAAFNPETGMYVCAYESNRAGGVFQIKSRRLQKDGLPDSGEVTVAPDGGNFQGSATMCFDEESGRFTVAFREFLRVGGGPLSEWALTGQMDAVGMPLGGGPTLAGQMAYEMQLQPSVRDGTITLLGRHAGLFVFSRMESQVLDFDGAPIGVAGILTSPAGTAPLGQSAYDSRRDRFLMPWRNFDLGTTEAMFVSGSGATLSGVFDLGLGASDYVAGPRAAYSAAADSFLVVQANAAGDAVRGAIIDENGVNKGVFDIDPAAGGFLARPSVVYAAGVDAFIVGWLRANNRAMVQAFDAEGMPISMAIKIREGVTLFDELPALTFAENTLDGSILVMWTENAGDPGRSYTRVMSAVLRLE